MKKLVFIPGSLRSASASLATVWALTELLGEDVDCAVAEPGCLPHYNADVLNSPEVEAFCDQITSSDGLVFVTPEYNYSIPGVLKNAIDWASRPALQSPFKGKPCFVISVSGGALGGVRAQSHLKYVLNGMLADVYTCPEIVIPNANQKIANGRLSDDAFFSFAMPKLRAFVEALP
ncbi:chromate reductase [Agrobacterium albertimagni AOL15]|uniref:Chromate reductase n=1 Tax=Agrobacterium albertimagni AOL15 TaxID=1156935 RepID=K2QFK6_9HYPH|nr:NADPH-dependent FMN reductase [Agrobacterium albertimagni]EKF59821.1 chromate reductase [Agrobacterium albertimagni AOL15]